jgi:hypothetical protein
VVNAHGKRHRPTTSATTNRLLEGSDLSPPRAWPREKRNSSDEDKRRPNQSPPARPRFESASVVSPSPDAGRFSGLRAFRLSPTSYRPSLPSPKASALNGFRSRLPLRGSPGFSPSSLWPGKAQAPARTTRYGGRRCQVKQYVVVDLIDHETVAEAFQDHLTSTCPADFDSDGLSDWDKRDIRARHVQRIRIGRPLPWCRQLRPNPRPSRRDRMHPCCLATPSRCWRQGPLRPAGWHRAPRWSDCRTRMQ